MDNYNLIGNNTEEQGWQQLSQPVYAEENQVLCDPEAENGNPQKEKKKHIVSSPIITFQLAVCLLFITLMYLSKVFMPTLFGAVMDGYDKEISTSMYFSGDFSSVDFSELFTATNDEV